MTEAGNINISGSSRKKGAEKTIEAVPQLDQVLGRYLSDEKRLHCVVYMLRAAQEALIESKLGLPVVIVGSSVTGKSKTDIDVYLDTNNSYLRSRSTGKYYWLDEYEAFLAGFVDGLKKIDASKEETPSTQVHNLIDRDQISQLPTLMYGYIFVIENNEILITTPKSKYSLDLKSIPSERPSLEDIKNASTILK